MRRMLSHGCNGRLIFLQCVYPMQLGVTACKAAWASLKEICNQLLGVSMSRSASTGWWTIQVLKQNRLLRATVNRCWPGMASLVRK
jgi:hypothetical protein